ncbi:MULTISPECIES: preprotein translocase subunit SecA [unclassified Burkholderia]|uniref:preprotein translocase subunit SecA n=1 Tax=unclassified Burkholderia TaxID=2613784 RepID=UPI000F583658|nr:MULTISPECIES: preprotein translocase subunit SecA [unclassified Burkholderia]MCR4465274.1 preprotein translocase subunit SecA [Burkholderia sp. SCN-KJ]RQR44521.1 preprotein translocase subunit SecA [Burkholderia sp. Bp9131]RQR69658.1 preprotein translocase subunit SecA [Burkholderia sp. Bp9015]RQR78247.1 preprotein translocase subunit SecA [Burkholderia sp. Bp9011]RQR88484.1 preprotein translocase subunit SecA [Burkholderia sp. Bp9010]
MTTGFLQKIFGSRNQRLVKQYQKTVATINALETQIEKLTDDQLRGKTDEFRQRIAGGESLDKLLPEAFAVCREASRRVLKMRHFDVQLIGGMVLHYGKIAEMRTGEGKTLVATLPVYLNALAGRGVHVVTVNDYLAQRDAEWMARLYNFLGLSVGINLSGMEHDQKQQAYASDITYGTNNEFGFDYLRDNMVYETDARVQRALNFAVVDEVDSILIDEARTPLIISGQAEDHTELYVRMNALPPLLERQIGEEKADGTGVEKPGDYTLDEKSRQVFLTESGHEKAERLLAEWGLIGEGESLYAPQNITLMHHVYAALRAHTLFHKDQHYVVQNGEVVIVDEFTGRLMAGRRWSDGLHQAVEAKEHVKIQSENQTLASITFQNYFRMYAKLAGMTGTADTEAYEFNEIYGLETVVIPTNRPPKRIDKQDQIYKTAKERYDAVIRDIRECYERGQPVLVGTTSIENSELLSHLLKQAGLPHEVLNAKQHEREAAIVAEAGRPKRITIATNMAGRGTDIVLGGNAEKQAAFIEADEAIPADEKARRIKQLHDEWETLHEQVKAAGGLHIIGTERHESRRIDNQLRGRAGRQGDPGSSRFYLSLDDPLLRIFAGDRVRSIMDRLKMPEGEAIEAGIVTRSIESAQRKVEARNFDIRKQLLEYDDVSNDQRKVIYQQRNELLEAHDITETISAMRHGVITEVVRQFVPEGSIEEQWDVPELEEALRNDWQLDLAIQEMVNESSSITAEEILEAVTTAADEQYEAKVALVGRESFSAFERSVMLQTVDRLWREHLAALDHLRQGIHLRGYAQKNPKQEYKREAFELFAAMLDAIKQEVTRIVMNVQIQSPEQLEEAAEQIEERGGHLENVEFQHADYAESGAPVANVAAATAATATADMVGSAMTHSGPGGEMPKVGRNDPCPCGSGKKYKQCHGKLS